MKKKEIIIYGTLLFLAGGFFLFSKMKSRKAAQRKAEHHLVAAPEYDKDGYYVENQTNAYKKFDIFGRNKAKDRPSGNGNENRGAGLGPSGGLAESSGQGEYDNTGFAEFGTAAAGAAGSAGTSAKGEAVDIFGFEIKDGEAGLSAASSAGAAVCPCCGEKVKPHFGSGASSGNMFSAASGSSSKKKGKSKSSSSAKAAGKAPKANGLANTAEAGASQQSISGTKTAAAASVDKRFNTIEITPEEDSLAMPEAIKEQSVTMFFKAELFGSQKIREDYSVQIKSKEPIVTPEISFPAGTIFYGQIKQSKRRFTARLHRALYNYNDYPVETEMRIYDMSFTEGFLILDFEDEIKDENSDELIDGNTELARELAYNQAMTTALLAMANNTTKGLKKRHVYTIDLADGHELLIALEVPRTWFYSVIENKESRYDY